MPPKKPIRILIADDHAVVRVGLVSMLSIEDDLEIVGEAEYGEQAVELFRKHLPDVALFDVRMPDISGIEAARRVRETCPEACILMLSTSDLDEEVAQALDVGAAGYLLKTGSQPALVHAIRGAALGERQFSPAMLQRLAAREHLTPRELDVLAAMRRGLSNKEISTALDLSEHTIKTYVKGIFAKFKVADRAGAVAAGFARGFLKV